MWKKWHQQHVRIVVSPQFEFWVNHLERMPPEIVLETLGELDGKDMVAFRGTCGLYRSMISDGRKGGVEI
jgi:hypothetical protein